MPWWMLRSRRMPLTVTSPSSSTPCRYCPATHRKVRTCVNMCSVQCSGVMYGVICCDMACSVRCSNVVWCEMRRCDVMTYCPLSIISHHSTPHHSISHNAVFKLSTLTPYFREYGTKLHYISHLQHCCITLHNTTLNRITLHYSTWCDIAQCREIRYWDRQTRRASEEIPPHHTHHIHTHSPRNRDGTGVGVGFFSGTDEWRK